MLNKSLMFTDIHIGRKNNSEQHNQDCVNYINWMISQIKADSNIDHIIFLGDFFQTRSAIDISTIKYGQEICKLLNDLNLPIYMIIGNHDLYRKHSRDIYSTIMFTEFSNFIIIDEPQFRQEIGAGSFLCPYIFKHEYHEIKELKQSNVVFAHAEFNNFCVTGYYRVKNENGPEPDQFKGPKVIFSGHFHQRQIGDNIVYIGNTFGFDFSDVDDNEKGVCVYDHNTEKYEFINWDDSPRFTSLKLSDLLSKIESGTKIFKDQTSVNCIIDIPLSYEQHIVIKKLIASQYNLRQFNLKELPKIELLEDTDVDDDINFDDDNMPVLNDLVVIMLDKINDDKIDKKLLKKLYGEIS